MLNKSKVPFLRKQLTPGSLFPAELGFLDMYDLLAGRAPCQHLIYPLIGFQRVFFAALGAADKGILSRFDSGIDFRLFFTASAKKEQNH